MSPLRLARERGPDLERVTGGLATACESAMWEYVAGDKWISAPSMKVVRQLPAVLAIGHRVFVFGGCLCTPTRALVACEVFDTKANTWTTIKEMPTARFAAAAVQVNDDEVWVLGGTDAKRLHLDVVESYKISTDTWTTLPWKLSERRAFFGAAYSRVTGALLVASGDQDADSVKVRNRDGVWSTLTSLPSSQTTAVVMDA